MKVMRLSDLKKRKDAYYKKIGIITPKGRTKKQIEYIVSRSFDALSKNLKQYIEDRQQLISIVTNTIIASGEVGQVNPYKAIQTYARQRKRRAGGGTAEFIFRRFREEYPGLYSKYNSYVYRLGYSSSQYFYDNVEISETGSVIEATLELPQKTSGVVYNQLNITYDFSGQDFWAEMN